MNLFTCPCSKSTKETLEKCVKYDEVVLMSLLLTLNIFYIFFNTPIVAFEQVNVNWPEMLNRIVMWIFEKNNVKLALYQPAITFSKLAIETLDHVVKYVQS